MKTFARQLIGTRRQWVVIAIFAASVLAVVPPVAAQTNPKEADDADRPLPPPVPLPRTSLRKGDGPAPQQGKIANSAVGRAGERQAPTSLLAIAPTARLQTRIASRVRLRLANRVDQNYSAEASPTASFAAADEQLRRSNRLGRVR